MPATVKLASRLVAAAAIATAALPGAAASTPAIAATTPAGFVDCVDCPAMVIVPPGVFDMGSSDDERRYYGVPEALGRREAPRHRVTIAAAFAIGRTEVTLDQYARFVDATRRPDDPAGCATFDRASDSWIVRPGFTWRHPGVATSATHPVTCVSWNDATAFAAWLSQRTGRNYRLPSEAEWEYAARGGTATAAYWGDSAELSCANANVMNAATDAALGRPASWRNRLMCNGAASFTVPVASYKPNPFGLYDMIGNVWEWAADCARPDYAGAPGDGSALSEPGCPTHSIRGGAFHSAPYFARAASRGYGKAPGYRSIAIGFRLAADVAAAVPR